MEYICHNCHALLDEEELDIFVSPATWSEWDGGSPEVVEARCPKCSEEIYENEDEVKLCEACGEPLYTFKKIYLSGKERYRTVEYNKDTGHWERVYLERQRTKEEYYHLEGIICEDCKEEINSCLDDMIEDFARAHDISKSTAREIILEVI